MFNKLRQKLIKLTKSKKQNQREYKKLHKKLQNKLHKLNEKTDKKSQEEIFILEKTIQKIEKKL